MVVGVLKRDIYCAITMFCRLGVSTLILIICTWVPWVLVNFLGWGTNFILEFCHFWAGFSPFHKKQTDFQQNYDYLIWVTKFWWSLSLWHKAVYQILNLSIIFFIYQVRFKKVAMWMSYTFSYSLFCNFHR